MEQSRWTQEHELLAVNAEITHALLSAFVQANSKGGRRMPPLVIPRPGREDRSENVVTHRQMAALSAGGS